MEAAGEPDGSGWPVLIVRSMAAARSAYAAGVELPVEGSGAPRIWTPSMYVAGVKPASEGTFSAAMSARCDPFWTQGLNWAVSTPAALPITSSLSMVKALGF